MTGVSERWPWDEIEGRTIVRIAEVDATDLHGTGIRIELGDNTSLIITAEQVDGDAQLRWWRGQWWPWHQIRRIRSKRQ